MTTWSQGNLHYIRLRVTNYGLHFFQLDREFFCLLPPSFARLYSAAVSPSERPRSDGSLAIIFRAYDLWSPNPHIARLDCLVVKSTMVKLQGANLWRSKLWRLTLFHCRHPMGMAKDIIWSLTWGTYHQILTPKYSLSLTKNTCKNVVVLENVNQRSNFLVLDNRVVSYPVSVEVARSRYEQFRAVSKWLWAGSSFSTFGAIM